MAWWECLECPTSGSGNEEAVWTELKGHVKTTGHRVRHKPTLGKAVHHSIKARRGH